MDKKIKQAIGKSAAIAGVAATLLSGGIGDDDAINELLQKELKSPEAKTEYVNAAGAAAGTELPPTKAELTAEANTPLWRSIISIPLWIVTHLISMLLDPILGKIGVWLFAAAAIIGIVTLSIKSIFPDMPIKDILSKKTLGLSLAGAALLVISDAILSTFSAGYIKWKNVFRVIFGMGIILLIVFRRARKIAKAKPAKLSF